MQVATAMDNERLELAMRDPEIEDMWIAAMKARLTHVDHRTGRIRPCPRTMVLYADLRGLVKTQIQLAINLMAQLGVRDEGEAMRYIDMGKRLEAARNDASMTLEQYHDEALEIMEICHKQKPELRDVARSRIG